MGWDPRTVYPDVTYQAYVDREYHDAENADVEQARVEQEHLDRVNEYGPSPWWSAFAVDAHTLPSRRGQPAGAARTAAPVPSRGSTRPALSTRSTSAKDRARPCRCSCHGRGFGHPPCGACWDHPRDDIRGGAA